MEKEKTKTKEGKINSSSSRAAADAVLLPNAEASKRKEIFPSSEVLR